MANPKILIVEDELIAARDLKGNLVNMGYNVSAVTASGEEALKKIAVLKPDLVLMDIKLKGKMNGIETAGQVHALFDAPIVYLTAYADQDALERAKKTEPYGFIYKPFQVEELKAVIETALYKHEMDKKLKERETWLDATLQSISDAVIATDVKGKITFMNPVAEDLTGWKQEECQEKSLNQVFKIVNEITDKRVANPVTKVLKEGVIVGLSNHTVLIARDGRRIPIDDSCSPIRDGQGNITGAVLVFRDVTQKKNAEKELRKSEEQYKGLFEYASSGVAVYEAQDDGNDFIFKDFNQAAEKIENINGEKVIGKSVLKVFPGVKEFGLFEVFQKVWRTGKPEHHPITLYKDERIAGWRENYVYKLPTGEIVAVYDDITERKQADQKIKRLNLVLRAIRNVNQLIVREQDPAQLVQQACHILVENKGYRSAWIALRNNEGKYETVVQAGLGVEFNSFQKQLKQGRLKTCGRRAIKRSEIVIVEDVKSACGDCPLLDKVSECTNLVIRLEHESKIYGLMAVSIPLQFTKDEEERSLFEEIAGDIAFALHNIELEEERERYEKELDRQNAELQKRLKELNCLYEISYLAAKPDVSLENLLKNIVEIIPPSWQYPEITCARIVFGDLEFKSENFESTEWKQSANIAIDGKAAGAVEVFYLEERPIEDEGPFLKEEGDLLETIARNLGKIVEQTQVDEALRIERDNLNNIFGAMEDGIHIVNQQYDIQYVNPVLVKDFGCYEDRKCYEYFHDRKEVCPWCKNPDVFAGKTVRWEWYSFKNQRTYDLIDTPLKNSDGSISKLEMFRDITERKRAEAQLKMKEAQLRAIMEVSPDYIWLLDWEFKILYVNRTGSTQNIEDLLGISILSVLPKEKQAESKQHLKRALKSRTFYKFEIDVQAADGSPLVFENIAIPIKSDGQTVGLTINSRDITERREAEEQIQRNLKEKEVLLKEIHHRVKNNLQIMSSLLSLQSAKVDDERLSDILNESRSHIRSMSIVHEMMYQNQDFARIDMKYYINKLKASLTRLYNLDVGRFRIQEHCESVQLDLNRAIPCGLIMNELISNAMKHAFPDGRKGEIEIRLEKKSGKVQLSVRDNGIALPSGLKTSDGDTLGMTIISDLTDQLDGSLKIVQGDGFKVFEVVFSIHHDNGAGEAS